MKIVINGKTREVGDAVKLSEVVEQLSPGVRIAIELNHEVVRRKDWGDVILRDDDRIEIVHFVGGG